MLLKFKYDDSCINLVLPVVILAVIFFFRFQFDPNHVNMYCLMHVCVNILSFSFWWTISTGSMTKHRKTKH